MAQQKDGVLYAGDTESPEQSTTLFLKSKEVSVPSVEISHLAEKKRGISLWITVT
jgi:hypothetical protein